MRAISIRQPWASLIDQGDKSIEVRSWPTKYRGPLTICASATQDPEQPDLPVACALCVVDLVDCRPMTEEDADAACCDFSPDHYSWVLSNIRQFPEPLPQVKGRLGLFDLPLSDPAA